MKIVVPVKQVAALDDEFELLDDGAGVDPDFVERDLNEWDAFSLEAALLLKEAAGDGEVVAVSVGDDEAAEGLLTCLAKGADRGGAGLGRRARGRRRPVGRARPRRGGRARVAGPRALRRAVLRRRQRRHGHRAGRAPGAARTSRW